MALAPVTWTTTLGDCKIGHCTLEYGATDQGFKMTLADSAGGADYHLSEPIDTLGFDTLIYKLITLDDPGSGNAFSTIGVLGYDSTGSSALATGDRVHAIEGTAGHTINLIDFADMASAGSDSGDSGIYDFPTGATQGSGNDAYLLSTVGWLDLRSVGKFVVVAGIGGSSNTIGKIEVQLLRRRS